MMQPATQARDDDEPEISVRDVAPSIDVSSDHDLVGEPFGKYELVGELAKGGMAEVFLGVHRGLEDFLKVVVIKRVLPQFNSDEHFVRMFVDEARLAARLDHPNIVRTYEFGEVDGQYFTTMEYLPGEDLGKTLNRLLCSRQFMPLELAAGIVAKVCAGLHFAHQLTDTAGRPLNVVHRDINPANIIITYGGEVKIIDFGVAKTNTNAETIAGTIKGKIAYMAPEQLLARGVDQRSDVFSAGVVLWELLVRKPLFLRDSEAATLYAIMNDPIPPPSRYRPDVPEELEAIVMRALARTPADRFETAEDMQVELEGFLEHQFEKHDARALAKKLEELFGLSRAEAKRSIAQSRSLSANISVVMKRRNETGTGSLHSFAAGSRPEELASDASSRSRLVTMLAGVMVLGIVVGLLYLVTGTNLFGSESKGTASAAHASLKIESTPAGAAISLGGEPTGLKTPATITGITTKQVVIRLELPNYGSITQTVDVPAGATIAKKFTLKPHE